jgi:metal-sulfur cluster biosynthetic enzyme
MPASSDAIVDALRQVIDPCCRERGISVVDMGLLHDVRVEDDGHAHVEIMLTSGWCPFQLDLVTEIEDAVAAVPEVTDAAVSITLEQTWSTDRLSPSAAAQLRFLPNPNEVGDRTELTRRALPLVAMTRTPASPTERIPR